MGGGAAGVELSTPDCGTTKRPRNAPGAVEKMGNVASEETKRRASRMMRCKTGGRPSELSRAEPPVEADSVVAPAPAKPSSSPVAPAEV